MHCLLQVKSFHRHKSKIFYVCDFTVAHYFLAACNYYPFQKYGTRGMNISTVVEPTFYCLGLIYSGGAWAMHLHHLPNCHIHVKWNKIKVNQAYSHTLTPQGHIAACKLDSAVCVCGCRSDEQIWTGLVWTKTIYACAVFGCLPVTQYNHRWAEKKHSRLHCSEQANHLPNLLASNTRLRSTIFP